MRVLVDHAHAPQGIAANELVLITKVIEVLFASRLSRRPGRLGRQRHVPARYPAARSPARRRPGEDRTAWPVRPELAGKHRSGRRVTPFPSLGQAIGRTHPAPPVHQGCIELGGRGSCRSIYRTGAVRCQRVTRAANVRHPAGWLRWRLTRWLNLGGAAEASPTQGRSAAAHRNRAYHKQRDSELGSRPRRGPARRRRLRARGLPHASAPVDAAALRSSSNGRIRLPESQARRCRPRRPLGGPAGHGASLVLRSSHRRCDRGELAKRVFASESLHAELGDPSAHIADSAD